MAHPYHHALSSSKKWGGEAEEFIELHSFFDMSKAGHADFRHRMVLHHSLGIFVAERVFGETITISTGRVVPVRALGEQHVAEDMGGRIPSIADWCRCVRAAPWMNRPLRLSREFEKEKA